jgi:hypothetical protein
MWTWYLDKWIKYLDRWAMYLDRKRYISHGLYGKIHITDEREKKVSRNKNNLDIYIYVSDI